MESSLGRHWKRLLTLQQMLLPALIAIVIQFLRPAQEMHQVRALDVPVIVTRPNVIVAAIQPETRGSWKVTKEITKLLSVKNAVNISCQTPFQNTKGTATQLLRSLLVVFVSTSQWIMPT